MGFDDVAAAQRRPRLHLQHGGSDCRLLPRQRRLSRSGIGRLLQRLPEKRTEFRGIGHAGRVSLLLGYRLSYHYYARHDFQGLETYFMWRAR